MFLIYPNICEGKNIMLQKTGGYKSCHFTRFHRVIALYGYLV